MAKGEEEFTLRHLSTCQVVAPWIKRWAMKMRRTPGWKQRVGL